MADAIARRDSAARDLAQIKQRRTDAHELVDGEIDRVHGLAELNSKRDSLRADAFVKNKPVDLDRMASLDAKVVEVEAQIEAAREQTESARAAISLLDELVDRAAETVERAEQGISEARRAVYEAVRAQAVRPFNTQVHAMRDTLLTLEAVDGTLGAGLFTALRDRGLYTVSINSRLERPA